MEITLSDSIKINGEEIPEYLLKALYEALKCRYSVVQNKVIQAPIQTSSSKQPSSKYLIR